MKKEGLMIAFVLIFLVVGSVLVIAEDKVFEASLDIEVETTETILAVNLSKNYVNLGETTAGYQTNPDNFTITNIGTRDFYITSSVQEDSSVFLRNFLRLNRYANCATNGWNNLTKFDLMLDKPFEYGGVGEPHTICVKLDLRDLEENIVANETLTTELTFWITPA
jgi:hypothetical protein